MNHVILDPQQHFHKNLFYLLLLLFIGIILFFLSHFSLSDLYSRRWRKNNFLKKSPDDTKKEDNERILK